MQLPAAAPNVATSPDAPRLLNPGVVWVTVWAAAVVDTIVSRFPSSVPLVGAASVSAAADPLVIVTLPSVIATAPSAPIVRRDSSRKANRAADRAPRSRGVAFTSG